MKGYIKQISELDRSTLTVVALQFFVNASTFTSFPLLSVWLSKLGHSASLIATLLTIVLVVTKGLPLIGGQIVDRFGAKAFLVMGLLFRFVGFLSISFAQEPSALIISAILIGLGGAAYETASYGLLAKSPDAQRKFVFLINNQALNLGVILGPGLGAILVNFDIKLTFLSSSILFFGGAVVAFFAVAEERASTAVPHNMLQLLKRVYSNRRFLALCAVLVPWWIIFAQLYTSFPIYYFSLSHDLKNSQDIFLTNGIAGLLFSVVLVQLVKSREESSLIQLAYLMLASIFLITPFALVKMAFIGIVVIYTAAETIILPSSDSEVGKIAEKGMEATYFGAAHISWIVGGTIGNYLGTYASDNNAYTYLWITLSCLAFAGLLATRHYQTTDKVALQHKHN